MIWQRFIDNKEEIVKKYRGDQDWITECVRYKARIWPYTWCMSYKWEFAGDFDKSRPPECYRPKKRIKVPKDLRIVVFHGKPNPEDVLHNSVIKNNYL